MSQEVQDPEDPKLQDFSENITATVTFIHIFYNIYVHTYMNIQKYKYVH